MVCKPVKFKGLILGLLLAGFFFGITIWGINFALGPEDKVFRLMLLIPTYVILFGFAVVWLGLATIKYRANDDGLAIFWAFKRYTIPWSEISEVMSVSGRLNFVNFFGISWPGYIAGIYEVRGVAICKIFGTNLKQLLVINSGPMSYGITPSQEFANLIAERSTNKLTSVDLYDLPDEVIGKVISEDLLYIGLFALNIICLTFFMIYLGIFFPGSGATSMVILLLVLAWALLAFNMVNATRLYHYAPVASYALWSVDLIINITFLVISMSMIGFGL